jgi:hypothetical protein
MAPLYMAKEGTRQDVAVATSSAQSQVHMWNSMLFRPCYCSCCRTRASPSSICPRHTANTQKKVHRQISRVRTPLTQISIFLIILLCTAVLAHVCRDWPCSTVHKIANVYVTRDLATVGTFDERDSAIQATLSRWAWRALTWGLGFRRLPLGISPRPIPAVSFMVAIRSVLMVALIRLKCWCGCGRVPPHSRPRLVSHE